MNKAVVFDLDDTLYDEKQFVFSGFTDVAGFLEDRYGFNRQVSFERMRQLLFEKGRGKIFNQLLAENGLDCTIVNDLVQIYRSHLPSLQLYPDAKSLLKSLQSKLKIGLITDGAAKVQWNKIKALGLDNIVNTIIVTDDHGADCWKPSPYPYRLVMERLGMEPENCLYVGDNPEKDFVTAKQLGWHTVRIYRSGGMCCELKKEPEYEAEFEIHDLYGLVPILEKLWGIKDER